MEIDGDLEMVGVAVATGALLYRRDLGVQALRHGVSDAMMEIGHYIGQVTSDQLGRLDHGRNPAMRGPEVPTLPETLGPAYSLIVPQLAQGFLECPGPRSLEFHGLDRLEMRFGSLRHILLAVEPQVLALGQRGVALTHQRLVLAFPDLIHSLEHMAHDVEAIKYHLVIGLRHAGLARVDVGRPHVQTDCLDLLTAFLWEGLEVGRQTCFASLFTDVLHRGRLQIAHQSHIAMALGNGLLVHPQQARHRVCLGRPTTQHRALHDVPSLVPRDAQNLTGALHVRGAQNSNPERFEQMRKATPSLRPWQTHLLDPMLRTRHPRRPCVQVGEKLHAVQVTPCPLAQMVVDCQFLSTLRAGKSLPRRVRHVDLNTPLRDIHIDTLHRPRLAQSQQLSVQLHAFHCTLPKIQNVPKAYYRPTQLSEGPQFETFQVSSEKAREL